MAEATKGVLVSGEITSGALESSTKEMLAAARKLSHELGGEEVSIALAGVNLAQMAKEAISLGADKVYAAESPVLKEFHPDTQVAVLEKVCREHPQRLVIGAKTVLGRDTMIRLAFRLEVGLAQDCVSLSVQQGSHALRVNRPVYGGNAMATVLCHSAPALAVVRPKIYEPMPPDAGRRGEVITIDPGIGESAKRTQIIKRVEEQATGVKLEDAKIVVGAGRGMGGPENLNVIQELANLLGGAMGASRAVCDAGWLAHKFQVGLTGKSIAPDLYLTVGISGASQHLAGCSGAKAIVSINKDREANIFKVARYGVVGDWHKVLPAFMEQVQELVK